MTYWQKSLPVGAREWHSFHFELSTADGTLRLMLDDKNVPLDGLQIDFADDYLEDVEFFVNSDRLTIDSEDARFNSSPYVRISNFGMWNE